MTSRIWLCAALLAIAACDNTGTEPVTTLDLTHPVDVGFACYGGLRITNGAPEDPDPTHQPIETIGQPTTSCDIRSQAAGSDGVKPVPTGQDNLTKQNAKDALPETDWYGFILQPTLGTVMVSKWPTQPASAFTGADITIQDVDPLTPGTNGIAIGEDPVAIGTSTEGCFEVTANAGTCDLSYLDIGTALDGTPGATVDSATIKNAAGAVIHAKPAAIAMQPAGGVIGVPCPQQPTGLVYIAYPSCHAVAAVDLASNTVVASIQYDASGVPAVKDGNLTCADECAGEPVTPGTRPVTLSLLDDENATTGVSRRVLAIGADNSASVAIVDLGTDFKPQSVRSVALEDTTGSLGVTKVAVSRQIGMGGSAGVITDSPSPGGPFQFLYAIATDNTVRVANITSTLTAYTECDTQVDPRYLHDQKSVKTLSCLPVGDPATPPRRPGARGPGIHIAGDAVPTSIDTFRVDAHAGDIAPTQLIGDFAVVAASDGHTYVLNINDDDQADVVDPASPIGTAIPLDIANQLRDSIPDRGLVAEAMVGSAEQPICDTAGPSPTDASGNTGGARTTADPVPIVPPGTFAAEKLGELPSIQQVKCVGNDEPNGKPVSELSFAAPIAVRDQAYPDLFGLRPDETWTLTWEGSLSNDQQNETTKADGPGVRTSQIFVDALGMRIDDDSHPFCDAGVQPWDIVQLRGCDPSQGNAQCPLGYTCYVHPESQVQGLGACMLQNEADRLAAACKEYLTSLRRYTVGRSTSGELTLLPRKHELITTPLSGCTDDAQCQTLATYADENAESSNPVDDKSPPDMHTWKCAADPDRAPLTVAGNTGKRCIESCTQDSDCTSGTVCANGFCMEGVIPPQACINAPQRYELRAHDAFTVLGSVSGYIHSMVADAAGNCVQDPKASPLQVGRIPLTAPACDPTADPLTGALPGGGFEPNPCELQTSQTELEPTFATGSCTVSSQTLVTRQADAIQFRNPGMTFTLVDPTYPGDARCIGDRQGTLGSVPVVPTGFQLQFEVTAGFTPLALPIAPAFPVKILRGPQQSIWVVDEGDVLSTDLTIPSTAGKVYRVESSSLSVINTVE
jgi:hypothetical protein